MIDADADAGPDSTAAGSATSARRVITVPTMPMIAQGSLAVFLSINGPRSANLTRAVEVPEAGHRLVEENRVIVTTELLALLAGG